MKKILFIGATLLAASTTANAALITLTNVKMQQTGPAASPGQRFANVTGSGTWTWDNVTNVVTQTGSNTFTFGPNLPSTVAYVLNFSNTVITGAGATTASAYSCTDGNFADQIAASICGGYNFYDGDGSTSTNFDNESVLINTATTCSRTIGGNDTVTSTTICLANAFNNGTNYSAQGTNAMSVRDTSGVNSLKVRPTSFSLTAPWGAAGSGWELQFTTTVVPVPAAGWLLGSALLGLAGIARRKGA